jgi:hypothetical protein
MTDRHDLRREPPTTHEAVFDFLKARLGTIVGIGALGLAWASYKNVALTLPREVKLFGLTLVILLPAGWMVASWVMSQLWDPNHIYLLDLDARYTDGALYQFPFEQFHSLDVTQGHLDEVTSSLYIGRDVDLDEMTVSGTWRGTLDDRELLRALHTVYECRGQLEDDARIGFALETSAFTIVRNAVRQTTRTVVRTFEKGTLPDEGEGVNQAIDDAIEKFDLEEHIEDEIESDLEEASTDPEILEQQQRDRADRGGDPLAEDPTELAIDD